MPGVANTPRSAHHLFRLCQLLDHGLPLLIQVCAIERSITTIILNALSRIKDRPHLKRIFYGNRVRDILLLARQ